MLKTRFQLPNYFNKYAIKRKNGQYETSGPNDVCYIFEIKNGAEKTILCDKQENKIKLILNNGSKYDLNVVKIGLAKKMMCLAQTIAQTIECN